MKYVDENLLLLKRVILYIKGELITSTKKNNDVVYNFNEFLLKK
jgi:hypothetical protein